MGVTGDRLHQRLPGPADSAGLAVRRLVAAREFVCGHRPLVALLAAHHPVAVGRGDPSLERLDDLARPRRPCSDDAAPAPLVTVDVLVTCAEDVVADRPGIAVAAL